METLLETVGSKLAPYYRAQDEDGLDETLLHAFWVQLVKCGSCGHEYHAHPRFRLASDRNIDKQWIVCRECGEVNKTRNGCKTAGCACGVHTTGAAGNVDRGAGICPCCGHRQKLIDEATRTGATPRFHLFAVETIPSGPERRFSGADQRMRSATAFDRKMFEDARKTLFALKAEKPGAIPPSPIPQQGRKEDRLFRYG